MTARRKFSSKQPSAEDNDEDEDNEHEEDDSSGDDQVAWSNYRFVQRCHIV